MGSGSSPAPSVQHTGVNSPLSSQQRAADYSREFVMSLQRHVAAQPFQTAQMIGEVPVKISCSADIPKSPSQARLCVAGAV